jgi:anti-sigma factor RsiW
MSDKNDMADNKDMDALLVAYADGELDPAKVAEVEAWLATTPAAQQTLAMYRETASLLRAAFPEIRDAVIPAALQGGALTGAALKADGTASWRRRRLPPTAWAVAAGVVMSIIGYGTGAIWPDLISSERSRMLSEVAEYHSIYSRETVHLVEVPAAQSEHLKAWLGKRVNGTLVIPDFKAAGLTFAGGRLVVLDGEPVAELMYTREHGLPIAFCVLSHGGKADAVAVERRGELNLATWDDGAHSYIVVGEADAAMIRQLATMARKQL